MALSFPTSPTVGDIRYGGSIGPATFEIWGL